MNIFILLKELKINLGIWVLGGHDPWIWVKVWEDWGR